MINSDAFGNNETLKLDGELTNSSLDSTTFGTSSKDDFAVSGLRNSLKASGSYDPFAKLERPWTSNTTAGNLSPLSSLFGNAFDPSQAIAITG